MFSIVKRTYCWFGNGFISKNILRYRIIWNSDNESLDILAEIFIVRIDSNEKWNSLLSSQRWSEWFISVYSAIRIIMIKRWYWWRVSILLNNCERMWFYGRVRVYCRKINLKGLIPKVNSAKQWKLLRYNWIKQRPQLVRELYCWGFLCFYLFSVIFFR